MSAWKIVEHTADVGLEATGETFEQAIEETIAGFGGLVCPEGEVEAARMREFTVEAPHLDDLVVDLLDEINYLHQVEHFVPAQATAELREDEEGVDVTIELAGEDYDPNRHGHLMEIKATTYHGLVVERDPPRIQVLFDV